MRVNAPALRGLTAVTGASLAAALMGACTLIVAARELGEERYADFAVLWGAFFAVAGVLSGIQQETTRVLSGVRRPGAGRARAMDGAILIGGASAAISIFLINAVGEDRGRTSLVATSVFLAGVLSLTAFVLASGSLAALRRWASLGALVTADASLRLLLTLVLLPLRQDRAVYSAIVCLPVAVGLVFLLSPSVRAAISSRSQITFWRSFRRLTVACMLSGIAALLLAGLPFLIALTSRNGIPQSGAPLLAAVVLVRAPLLILLNGIRLPLINVLVSRRESGGGGHIRKGRFFLLLAALASPTPLVIVLGPGVLSRLLGDGFRIDGWLLGGFYVSSMLMATLATLGVTLLARDQHNRALIMWGTALTSTVVALVTPMPFTTRVMAAATAGPIAGCLVGLWMFRIPDGSFHPQNRQLFR